MNAILVALELPVRHGRAALYTLSRTDGGAEPARSRLDGDRPESNLTDRLADAVGRGFEGFVLDLGGVDEVDGKDVMVLTDLAWSIRAEGGFPVVVSPHQDVTDTLRLAKMDRAFEIFGGTQQALVFLAENG